MATTAPPAATETTSGARRRPKASQLTMAIGVLVAVITVGSYAWATVFGFEDDSPVHREVLQNIPDALVGAFYATTTLLILWGAYNSSLRVQNWQRGAPDRRATTTKNVGRRLKDFRAGVYMQTLLRDKGAGLMHSLIYFSFLTLLAVTTISELDHAAPESLKFLHGDVYRGYPLPGAGAGIPPAVGVLGAIYRRYVQRVYRIRIKTKPEHALILGTLLALSITGFGAEAFRIAL